MAKTAAGNALSNGQKMRRKNKRTSIGNSKNSRPNNKTATRERKGGRTT